MPISILVTVWDAPSGKLFISARTTKIKNREQHDDNLTQAYENLLVDLTRYKWYWFDTIEEAASAFPEISNLPSILDTDYPLML